MHRHSTRHAFLLSWIDYCNSDLLGLPDIQSSRPQSVLNVSACLIFACRWNDQATPLLKDKLHWLRIPKCIAFKRCPFTYRALNDLFCPGYRYIASLVSRTTSNDRHSRLHSCSYEQLVVPPPAKTAKFGDRLASCGNPILQNS